MGILFWILCEVLLWGLVFTGWLLFLPVALVVACPIILIVAAVRGKSFKDLFLGFVEWWTYLIPTFSRRGRQRIKDAKTAHIKPEG